MTEYSDELMHYGVKGMKWGVRRAQKRVEKAYRNAGDAQGRADYVLSKGRKRANESYKSARTLEKSAKEHEQKGHRVRAKIHKYFADAERSNAREVMRSSRADAKEYLEASDYYKERASKIASKKNVSIGQNRIDELLAASREKGRLNEEVLDRIYDYD